MSLLLIRWIYLAVSVSDVYKRPEVSDALFLYDTADKTLSEHQAQLSEMQKAVEMNNDLFLAGKATYLEIITAQQSLLSAQLNEVSDTFHRMQAVINLYSACLLYTSRCV